MLSVLLNAFAVYSLPMQGILGVIDGVRPLEFENDDDKKKRHEFLRMIGECDFAWQCSTWHLRLTQRCRVSVVGFFCNGLMSSWGCQLSQMMTA
jgi:hypothetical protein